MVMVRIPCQVVHCHAQPDATLADIWGTWSPPAVNVRLWQFGNIAITSYNGTHVRSAARGRRKHLAAPVIAVRMIPFDPLNSCRTVSVLLTGTSCPPVRERRPPEAGGAIVVSCHLGSTAPG